MSPIPDSGLPGHRRLHDRIVAALDTCQELQSVEFKRSAPWDDLKWRIIRTAMGMGNLRDGGVIVIGVAEQDDSWEITGIGDTDLQTFEPDVVVDAINKYVSPPMQPEIVKVEHNGFRFLAIQLAEFDGTPFVCKKNSPDKVGAFLQSHIFIRPPGKPQTKRIMDATEMHDLLELAAEKRARQIIEIVKRLGLSPSEDVDTRFDDELEGL